MGIMGEMFGPKLNSEGDEDGSGRTHQPRFALDLDSGTVQVQGPVGPATDQPEE